MASIYKRKDSTNWMVSWVDNVDVNDLLLVVGNWGPCE